MDGGDGNVTVDEIVTGVNQVLGHVAVAACESLDTSSDGRITIDELISGIQSLLNGCSAVTQ